MRNQYYIIRHGHSLGNKKNIASCWPEKFYNPLTEKGKKQIKEIAEKMKDKKIDLIFSSDVLRTKQTAEIIGKKLGLKPKFDKRLREIDVGIFNGESLNKVARFWDKEKKLSSLEYYKKKFKIASLKGENYADIEKRMCAFIKDIDKKYKLRNILIISHKRPLTLLEKAIFGYDFKKFVRIILEKKEIRTGELRRLSPK